MRLEHGLSAELDPWSRPGLTVSARRRRTVDSSRQGSRGAAVAGGQ